MSKRDAGPETLIQAVRYFTDPDVALAFVASIRWPDGVRCPHCGHDKQSFLKTRRIWKCLEPKCRRQFSVKVGTIFEDSPIGLDKWLPCLWLIVNAKNGISSYEVHRALQVTQKTAWFMLHRVRLAMQTRTFEKMGGEVEIDETFIGGRSRNMHKARRDRIITGSGTVGKVAVMGVLERHGRGKKHSTVRASIVANTKKRHLQAAVRENVEPGSEIFTDALKSYEGLDEYIHGVIDHSEKYVEGKIHTNSLENFWSLLKRSLKGTYVSVEPFHLFRYLDEQVCRFNNRKDNDGERFVTVLSNIIGKRLTYRGLTGADLPQTC